ncbi:hypothetical protein [Streptomyces sp. 8N706]|uniref:hypothetical protein n=1 Tax=Streptomyces sp. 8N706 TaxID=3457416 RepID=UPI003FD30C49
MTNSIADHTPQSKSKTKRTIIFDRNELSRAGFISLVGRDAHLDVIETEFPSVGMTTIIRQSRPDLIVIADDYRVLDRIERVTSVSPRIPIVAFADQWDRDSVMGALRLGVRGLGVKSGSRATIMAAIHAVAAGGTYLANSLADDIIGAALDQVHPSVSGTSEKIAALTAQERRVLTLLASIVHESSSVY